MDSYYSPSGSATRSASAKWVCPNDRQLALRAKLRTGWSVKSSSLDSRSFDYFRYSTTTTTTTSCPGSLSTKSSSNSNQPLTEEERERIIEVIKKADALDLSEQERVGRLVDRLENMKRNVTVVTSTRANGRSCGSRCIRGNICICCCALCGEKFTVLLGAAPGLCHDCRKYVCQKCGIETNTQSSSSSSSSSTNNNHQQKRRQQQFTGSTTNINTSDNTKPSPSTPPAKIFLCRICTETREMWKKSGAWFFKSLPKYVLPEKKPKSGSRGSHWTLAGGSKSLEPSELDSSSDEDFSRRPTRTRSFLFYSKSLDPPTVATATTEQKSNGNHLDIETDPVIMSSPSSSLSPSRKGSFLNLNAPDQAPPLTLSPQNQLTVPNISSAFSTSPSSLSPSPSSSLSPVVPRSRSSSRLRDQKEQCSSQSSIFYIPFSIGSCESVNNDSTIQNNKDKDNNTAKTGGGGRKSSIQSRELNDNNIDTTGFRKSRRTSINNSSSSNNEKENQRDQDHIPHQVSQLGMEKNNEMKNYGKLEITLRYEPLYHCLQCKVERARGLRPMDIHGHTDSYCKLIVLPQQQEDNNKTTAIKCQRTKTIYNTRDPLFNEQFNFYEIIENDLKTNKALHVLILLDDAAGRDFLGEAKFPLRELLPCQTKYYNVLLEDHQQQQQQRENMMMIWGEDLTNARGTIQLSLIYSTRRRALLVNIQRANNLLAMDTNGLSDPFVKLCLTRDIMKNDLNLKSPATTVSLAPPVNKKQLSPAKKIQKMSGQTHTTSVKWKTLNPEWNEEFTFEIRLTDLMEYALVITLWDKDFGKSNDYLGGLVLCCNSKGARLNQWIDTIKFPDHRHQATHELTEDITLNKSN